MRFILSLLTLFAIFAAPKAFAVPTALTVQEISETAYTQSLDDADESNGNSILNPSGDVFFIISNAHATNSAIATFTAAQTSVELKGYGPLTKSNLAITVAALTTKIVGPFQTTAWNDSAGKIQVTYSGTAPSSLSIKALRLKPSLKQ